MGSVTRVARNTIFMSASSMLGAFFSFLLGIVVARYLGTSGFGDYSFVIAFVAIFNIFFDSGLSVVVVREVARNASEAQNYIRAALAAKIIVTLLSFSALLAISLLAGYSFMITSALLVAGAAYVLLSFATFFLSFFKAIELMQYEAYLNVLERLANLAGVWIVMDQHGGLLRIMAVFLIVACVKFAVTLFLMVRRFGKVVWPPEFALSKKILILAVPFALTTIFSTAYFNVDMLLLAFFKSSADVGLYNVAYRFIYAVAFIPNTFTVALLPMLSRLFVSSKESMRYAYEKAFKYILLLAVPAAVGGVLLAPRIIRFFYGEEFLDASPALAVLSIAGGIVFISLLCNVMMTALNLQKKNAMLALGNLVVNIILDVALIPAYGIVGAGLATIAAEFCGMIGASWLIHREIKPTLHASWLFKAIIATGAMAFAVISIENSLLLLPTFAIGVAVYSAAIVLLGYFAADDWKMMQAIILASVAKIRGIAKRQAD